MELTNKHFYFFSFFLSKTLIRLCVCLNKSNKSALRKKNIKNNNLDLVEFFSLKVVY